MVVIVMALILKMLDIAIPDDSRIKDKQQEKIKKREELKEEIERLWSMKKVTVIPIMIGALGCVSQRFDSYMEQIGIVAQLQVIQKTALLGIARILRMISI